jgi:hypothetical protein
MPAVAMAATTIARGTRASAFLVVFIELSLLCG